MKVFGSMRFGPAVGSPALFALSAVTLVLGASAARGQGYVLWDLNGMAALEEFGFSVAGTGDVDGDGMADFIVGTPMASPGGHTYGGRAQVFSGSSGQPIPALIFEGTTSNRRLGYSVDDTGDLDGDGIPDIIVGAPRGYPGSVANDSGEVKVFRGGTGGTLYSSYGSPADSLGHSVSGTGDLNGDGVPDFLAGAPQSPGVGPGYARVFSGSTGSVLYTLSGASLNDRFGSSVDGVDDIDGDGSSDLVVGAPGDPFSGASGGYAKVFSGGAGTSILTFVGNPGDGLGSSVAGLEDVNGDAVPEVAVGAPQHNVCPGLGAACPGPGYVKVFSGFGGGTVLTLNGNGVDLFGSSVAKSGDVDLDGTPDLIVGAKGGCSPSPCASPPGYAIVFSGASGTPLFTFNGIAASDAFGTSVSGSLDVDGDGFVDLLVGSPLADVPGNPDAGVVKVFSTVGVPSGSALFGAACAGSGGNEPIITTSGGPPGATVGGNPAFEVALSKALGSTTAVLVMGLSPLSPAMNLGPLGSPGCSLYVSPDILIPVMTSGSGPGNGKAIVPMPVPALPVLAGGLLFFQWYVVDPGPAVSPGAVSEALLLLIL